MNKTQLFAIIRPCIILWLFLWEEYFLLFTPSPPFKTMHLRVRTGFVLHSLQLLILWHPINQCDIHSIPVNKYTDNNLNSQNKEVFYKKRIPHLNTLWNYYNVHSDQLYLCFPKHRLTLSILVKLKPVCNQMVIFSSEWRILLLIFPPLLQI